ncbi:TonB-dependent receptor [uncultured Polaribacter sp.]|uniref:TonB-dependent receptor n=1 Tax=uncultured Polaribacter sp. TaxID=174711 RepID=UPI0026179B13|nr:TonB-dependent receptor [uncultured Polaribacter sp.]
MKKVIRMGINHSFQLKLNLKMRITTLLLLVSLFQLHANESYSQKTKVTLDYNNVSLETVFDKIESLTEFKFIYKDKEIDYKRKISINVKKEALSKVLKKLFSKSQISFSVTGKQIILKANRVDSKINIPIKGKSQQIKISGTIVDDNNLPLPGASIIEKGSANGTQTDFDGNFSLTLKNEEAVLVIKYLGYSTKEVPVKGKTNFKIVLTEDAATLDEIVIIGYGQKKSRNLTTSVSKLNYKTLTDQNVTSFDQALSGQIAGVRVTQSSGAPGGNISVQIRGTGLSGGQPLYVIDGVPLDNDLQGATGTVSAAEQNTNPLSTINPDDILSINVLKDAAGGAIYGSRGSNGVVIITTKSGKKGKMKVSYKSTFGLQTVLNKVDVLDAYEYAQLSIDGQNENYINNNPGGNPDRAITDPNGVRANRGPIAPVLYPYAAGIQGLTNTDWQDEIFRLAEMNNHNISVSGGSDNSNYYVSGNFLQQEGVVINSGFKRYAFRMKYNVDQEKVKFGINIAPSYTDYDIVQTEGPYFRGGIISAANLYAPVFPVYNPDGTFNFGGNNWGFGHTNIINPVATATLLEDRKQQYRLLGNAFFSYEIFKDLTFKTSVGVDINHFKRDTYSPSTLEIRGRSGIAEAFARTKSDYVTNVLSENTLAYNKQLGLNHNINGVAGFSAQKNRTERSFARSTGFPNDLLQTLNAGTIAETAESNGSEWALLSYFSRLEYNYDEKYFFSVSARADGASRFGTNSKWGYFPSASLGWIASKEKFFENIPFVNFLKFRGSYGETGNFDIPNYAPIALLAADNYVFGAGEDIANGLKPGNLPNDKLTWETKISWNAGLDIALFNNKLDFTFDVYNETFTDFLFDVPVPAFTGFSSFLQNRGKVENLGFEMAATFRQDIGNVKVTANVNFSQNRNKVLELGPGGNPITLRGGASGADYITKIGEPMGSYFLYVSDGVFANQDEIDAVPHFAGTRPGDVRYVDMDSDGDVDADDRTIVGSYFPDYTIGGNLNLKYKFIDLGVAVSSVQGNEILNLHRRYSYNVTGNFNQLAGAVNRWRSEDNPGDGQTMRAKSSTGRNTLISTRFIEDGSFVKIQNISLGLTIPSEVLEQFKISQARLSVNVQNPFIWTKYTGYNPEVNARPNEPTRAGEDYGSYPIAKVFTLGINVTF